MLSKFRAQAGFAIVEVLVATVVLAIGFLELARAFRNINSVAVQAVAMTKASNLANATMERVMAQDFDARGNEANGKSLNFDGPDEYIDTGVPLQDTFRNSFTVSYWVKPDDGNPASNVSIFGTINSDDSDGVRSNIRTDGKIYFVDGITMDELGDAHAADGLCTVIHSAKVTGQVKDGRFLAKSFDLLVKK